MFILKLPFPGLFILGAWLVYQKPIKGKLVGFTWYTIKIPNFILKILFYYWKKYHEY